MTRGVCVQVLRWDVEQQQAQQTRRLEKLQQQHDRQKLSKWVQAISRVLPALGSIFGALQIWQEGATEARVRALTGKAVQWWIQRLLAVSWVGFRQACGLRVHQTKCMASAVNQWMHFREQRAWRQWHSTAMFLADLREIVDIGLARREHHALTTAWLDWRLVCERARMARRYPATTTTISASLLAANCMPQDNSGSAAAFTCAHLGPLARATRATGTCSPPHYLSSRRD